MKSQSFIRKGRVMKRNSLICLILLILFLVSGCRSLESLPGLSPPSAFADLESRFITVDNLAIHYRVSGEDKKGIPLILLHGFMANSRTWEDLSTLLGKDYPVYAYDRIAFGLSERPLRPDFPPSGSPYRSEAVVERALLLMDEWRAGEAVLVGSSAGGELALRIALAAPERIKALILIAPAVYSGGPSGFMRWFSRISLFENIGLNAVRSLGEDPEKLLSRVWYDPSRMPDDLRSAYLQPLRIENWDKALLEFIRASEGDDITEELKELEIPVLIIHGRNDSIVPVEDSIRLVDQISGAQLLVIEDCGHVPYEEYPEAVNSLIRTFLEKSGN